MQNFRSYIFNEIKNSNAPWLDINPPLLMEVRGARSVTASLPIPQSVMNVVNYVSYHDFNKEAQSNNDILAVKSQVLEWIYKNGLWEALINRRKMAEKCGMEQDELFSANNPNVADVDRDWFSGYNEPDTIAIKVGNYKLGYSLSAINDTLKALNLEPLEFGGSKGLIEYIESGKDSKGNWWKTDVHKNDLKHGIDLTLPEGSDGIYWDRKTNKQYFQFGQKQAFTPPTTSKFWNDRIKIYSHEFARSLGAIRTKARQVKKYKEILDRKSQGLSTPEDEEILKGLKHTELSPEETEALKRYRDLERMPAYGDLSDALGFHSRASHTSQYYIADPKQYELVKNAVKAGLEHFLNVPLDQESGLQAMGNIHFIIPQQGKEQYVIGKDKQQDLEHLMHYIFNDEKQTARPALRLKKMNLVRGMIGSNETNKYLKKFIDVGAGILSNKPLADMSGYQKVPYHKYGVKKSFFPTDEFTLGHEIDLKQLTKPVAEGGDGYEILNLSKQERSSGSIDPQRHSLQIRLPGTRNVMQLMRQNADSPWTVAKLSGALQTTDKINPFFMGTMPGIKLGIPPSSPRIGLKSERPDDLLRANAPELKDFFDHPEEYGDEIDYNSLDDPLPKSVVDSIPKDGHGIDRNNFVNAVSNKFQEFADYFEFKFGDPHNLLNISSNIDPARAKQFQQQVQELKKQWMDKKIDASTIERSLDPDLYAILLKNGFNWRVHKGKQAVMQQWYGQDRTKEWQFANPEGKEGGKLDVSANLIANTEENPNDPDAKGPEGAIDFRRRMGGQERRGLNLGKGELQAVKRHHLVTTPQARPAHKTEPDFSIQSFQDLADQPTIPQAIPPQKQKPAPQDFNLQSFQDLIDQPQDFNLQSFQDLLKIKNEHRSFKGMTFSEWLETYAVYDGTKPKDGCGWNWEGAVGKPGGVSAGGEVKTVKEDPDGSGKNKKRSKK